MKDIDALAKQLAQKLEWFSGEKILEHDIRTIAEALREYGDAREKDWARMYMEDLNKAVKEADAEGHRRGVEKMMFYADHRNECGTTVTREDRHCSCGFAKLQRGTGGGE